jgi:hypothetical protein
MSDDFPDVKLKLMVTFPASVIGGTGIDVTQQSGQYKFDLDLGELAQTTTISTAASPTTFLLLWESTQNTYRRISIKDFKAALAGLP